jgi:hypothetical protein
MKSQQVIISGGLIAMVSLFSVSAFANPVPSPYLASVKQQGNSCNVEIRFIAEGLPSYLYSSQTLENEQVPITPNNLILHPPPRSGYLHRVIHCNSHGGIRYYELFLEINSQIIPVEDWPGYWPSYPPNYPPSLQSIFLNEDCQPDLSVCDTPCDSSSCKLSVELRDFAAKLEANQIHFNWETATEVDNLGVNIWCAQIEGNNFKDPLKLNPKLIPTQGNSLNGTTYSKIYSIEATGLKTGVYHCGLEDVDSDGQCTLQCDHISSVTIGDGQSVSADVQAMALCNKYKREGKCLEQLLAPNTP